MRFTFDGTRRDARGETKGARTRRRLMDAAEVLLADRPLREVEMAQIARQAEVGRTSAYTHFGVPVDGSRKAKNVKDDIVGRMVLDRVAAMFEEVRVEDDSDFGAFLERAIRIVHGQWRTRRHVFLAGIALVGVNAEFAAAWNEQITQVWVDEILHFFEREVSSGRLQPLPVDHRAAVIAVYGQILSGFSTLFRVNAAPPDEQVQVDALVYASLRTFGIDRAPESSGPEAADTSRPAFESGPVTGESG